MAGLAGNVRFLAVGERESVGPQMSRPPGSRAVAAVTCQSKESGMDGRFLMAAGAGRRRAFELLAGMARAAIQAGMLPIEREDLRVRKSRHAICAIVTLQAVAAKILEVLRHERGFDLAVAARASCLVNARVLRGAAGRAWDMAGGTGQRLASLVYRMPDQGKRITGMIVIDPIHLGRFPRDGGVAG